jgi:hypothetical protein
MLVACYCGDDKRLLVTKLMLDSITLFAQTGSSLFMHAYVMQAWPDACMHLHRALAKTPWNGQQKANLIELSSCLFFSMRWGCSQPPASILRNDLCAQQFTDFFDVIPGKFSLPCRTRRQWQGSGGMAKRSRVASTGC